MSSATRCLLTLNDRYTAEVPSRTKISTLIRLQFTLTAAPEWTGQRTVHSKSINSYVTAGRTVPPTDRQLDSSSTCWPLFAGWIVTSRSRCEPTHMEITSSHRERRSSFSGTHRAAHFTNIVTDTSLTATGQLFTVSN